MIQYTLKIYFIDATPFIEMILTVLTHRLWIYLIWWNSAMCGWWCGKVITIMAKEGSQSYFVCLQNIKKNLSLVEFLNNLSENWQFVSQIFKKILKIVLDAIHQIQ